MIQAQHIGATVSTSGVQSGGMFSFAIGAMFLAFFVYITAKGELPKYLGFFLITPGTDVTGATAKPASGVSGVGASPAD